MNKNWLKSLRSSHQVADNETEKEDTLGFILLSKARLKAGGITILVACVAYYLLIPALNFKSRALYEYLAVIFFSYFIFNIVFSGFYAPTRRAKDFLRYLYTHCRIELIIFAIYLLTIIVGIVSSSVIICARSYYKLMDVSVGDFVTDIETISYDEIPLLDEGSASELGSRTLGNLSDMVSQFEVEGNYTQINFGGKPTRIASLAYGNFFKWVKNTGNGLPGYILVDMTSSEAEVVRTDSGIKMSSSELFNRDLMRWLRFRYPSYIFDEPHLEINESGDPHWICPVLDMTIGLFGGRDVVGAVIVNPITLEHAYYDTADVPAWVDQLYSSSLLIEQYEYHGKYANGWLNSVLGQADVTTVSAGFNFIVLNDDVYLYTGITSVGNDQSNIGFVLCNMRTRETRYYDIPGATETSAQASAEGVVQHLGYDATFPLLLNVANQPTYFMALKDGASLVKMYSMVDVQQYQIVATGNTIQECEENYISILTENGIDVSPSISESIPDERAEISGNIEESLDSMSGTVDDIRSAVQNGTTYYYIRLLGSSEYFMISAAVYSEIVLLDIGDEVTFLYNPTDSGRIITVSSVIWS